MYLHSPGVRPKVIVRPSGHPLIQDSLNPIVPSTYIEKPPFPVRIKDHAKASTMVRKSNARTSTPFEQIKVEPSIAMVKDLLVDNIDGHVIYFCDEVVRIANSMIKISIDLLLACLLS